MKILGFKAQNILNLKCVEIIPKGDTVILTGKNGAGKTDVLNAIWYALAGTKDIPSEPVRKGEEKGFTEVDLGEYIVTRKFSKGGETSSLEVKNKEGAKFPSPQSLLDKLIGNVSFNPIDIMTDNNRDEMLLEIAGLAGNLRTLDDERQEKYNQRTFENREAKKLEAQIKKGLGKVEAVDIQQLLGEMQNVEGTYEAIAQAEEDIQESTKKIIALKEEIKNLETQIEEAKESLKALQESKSQSPSLEELQRTLNEVEGINQRARGYEENEEIKAQYEERKKVADNLTKEIEEIDKYKQELIENAKFPVSGMGYRDNKVTFNDIPLDQLSKSEELLLGIQIQMALHPDLKVILVPDASLLDSDNMKKLEEMTGKEGYQIWVERVDDSGQVGVYIENGEIKGDNQ